MAAFAPIARDPGGWEADDSEMDDSNGPMGWTWRYALIGACALLFCGGSLLLARALWPVGGLWPEDHPVVLTDSQILGVRFAPAGISVASTSCPPFSMDPNRTTRTNMVQLPLRRDTALMMRAVDQRSTEPSWCSVDFCAARPPSRVVHLSNVCLHNDTLYAMSDRDAPRALLNSEWWGHPRDKHEFRRYLQEVASASRIPGSPLWLEGSWVLVTPRFRFGGDNIFHAILEEIGWLMRAMSCGSIAASTEQRYLLEHGHAILGRSTLGRLWELGTDGARSFFRPQAAMATTFCFRHAHVESSGSADEAVSACERLGRLALPAAAGSAEGGARSGSGGNGSSRGGSAPSGGSHELAEALPPAARGWPGWPARNASFRGFAEIVERARTRLGILPAAVGKVEGRWRTPRVTIVHRLRNRRILNLGYLTDSLRDEGFAVTVVSLECMPLEAQLALVSNSSTLLGVHGAGLTLGHALPFDALVIELRTAPCTEEAHGVPYQMRKRNAIIPAPRAAVLPRGGCPPPWKVNNREKDAVVDIQAVIDTILAKDPIASSPIGWEKSDWAVHRSGTRAPNDAAMGGKPAAAHHSDDDERGQAVTEARAASRRLRHSRAG